MRIKYIGSDQMRYGDHPLTSGDEIDLPENVAKDLIASGDFEAVAKAEEKKTTKRAKKTKREESQLEMEA